MKLFNLIAREEARASIKLADSTLKIAAAAKSDSGAMKTVAVMTMLFLPATFFAALFSMPLLQWGEAKVVQDQFWVYWWYVSPLLYDLVFKTYSHAIQSACGP